MFGRTHKHPDETARERIAHTVHEALSAWRVANGHKALKPWPQMSEAERQSTYESVDYVIAHPNSTPVHQHEQWLEQKKRDGWTYAARRNNRKKTHPMLLPYEELPDYERRKDALLNAIVRALHQGNEI